MRETSDRITPSTTRYRLGRRTFLKGVGAVAGLAASGRLAVAAPVQAAPAVAQATRGAATLPVAATGADVDEGRVVTTYHVAPRGSDENPGTRAKPFRTVGRGVAAALADKARHVGAKVVLANGTYREEVVVDERAGATAAPLVLEAVTPGRAVIAGSDEWRGGWTQDGAVWTHAWPYDWGEDPQGRGPSLNRRRELVFVDGAALRQVATPGELAEGTFAVDEAADLLYARPSAGVDLNAALVEVAVRTSGLWCRGAKHLVVRGLTIQHTTSFTQTRAAAGGGLVFSEGCANFLVEDCTLRWNNLRGLALLPTGSLAANPASADATLRRVDASYNGQQGFQLRFHKNLLVEDCETSYNNFRGDWAGWYNGFSSSAFKAMHIHSSTWRRHRAVGNWCTGMWWDIDNTHILVEDCFMDRNLVRGIFIEANQGPALVRRCIIANTRDSADVRSGNQGGLCISASYNVTLESNILYNNETRQFRIWDNTRRETNFETGEPYESRVERQTYRRNVLYATDAAQLCYDFPGKEVFPYLYETLLSDENLFYNPARGDVFRVNGPSSSGGVDLGEEGNDPGSPGGIEPATFDLPGWRAYSGQDANSLCADPAFANPAHHVYQLTGRSPSQLRAWGLPRKLPK